MSKDLCDTFTDDWFAARGYPDTPEVKEAVAAYLAVVRPVTDIPGYLAITRFFDDALQRPERMRVTYMMPELERIVDTLHPRP